jgi:hypothetical protein
MAKKIDMTQALLGFEIGTARFRGYWSKFHQITFFRDDSPFADVYDHPACGVSIVTHAGCCVSTETAQFLTNNIMPSFDDLVANLEHNKRHTIRGV